MRMIGTIPTDTDAERFSDYLLTQQIGNMVEESANGNWSVWVEHDDHLDRAKAELDAFLRNPSDARYNAAGETAEKIRKDQEKVRQRRHARYVDVRTRWGQANQWAAPVTLILIMASIVVSLGTVFGARMDPWGDRLRYASPHSQQLEPSDEEPARRPRLRREAEPRPIELVSPEILRGQVWRLITPILLHFGILHLLFNMFWLRDLGGMIEVQRGTRTMVAVALLGAVIGNTAEFLWDGPYFGGMSGVNYALFAYIWIKQRYEPHLGLGLSEQAVLILMGWLIISAIGIIGSAANAAHIAGLLTGAAFAYAPIAWRRARRARRT
jgi:GlpG protein